MVWAFMAHLKMGSQCFGLTATARFMPTQSHPYQLINRRKHMELINQNWTDENGLHDGGVSTGIGFTISWQRGALNEAGRNGAFLLEVLAACKHQLEYYAGQAQFQCAENDEALSALNAAISALEKRRSRRANQGTLGTHQPEVMQAQLVEGQK
jgi:hypothetical protein